MPVVIKRTSGKPKFILFLFFIVLMGPLLGAWFLVQYGNKEILGQSHHGDLISPLKNIQSIVFYDLNKHQDISAQTLLGKWWLVYVSPPQCHQTCHDTLYNMRQIRTALGKNASRLERLFIAHPTCQSSVCEQYLTEQYPDMHKAKMQKADFENLFGAHTNAVEREMIGELYIIDPKGNLMMHYSTELESRAILSDLKRLLKISKIG